MVTYSTFRLGAMYRDVISGFQGVATGYVQYISGCNQVLLRPKEDKGVLRDSQWFDEQQLERVGKSEVILDNRRASGFDKTAPIRK